MMKLDLDFSADDDDVHSWLDALNERELSRLRKNFLSTSFKANILIMIKLIGEERPIERRSLGWRLDFHQMRVLEDPPVLRARKGVASNKDLALQNRALYIIWIKEPAPDPSSSADLDSIKNQMLETEREWKEARAELAYWEEKERAFFLVGKSLSIRCLFNSPLNTNQISTKLHQQAFPVPRIHVDPEWHQTNLKETATMTANANSLLIYTSPVPSCLAQVWL